MADSGSIAQFMDVTGASQEAAKFFLDSSGGVVDAAIDQYFATGGEFTPEAAPEEAMAEPEPAAQPGASYLFLSPGAQVWALVKMAVLQEQVDAQEVQAPACVCPLKFPALKILQC
jgi:hypothetical protein